MSQPRISDDAFDQLVKLVNGAGVSYSGARLVMVEGLSSRAASTQTPCSHQAISDTVTKLRQALVHSRLCPHCGGMVPTKLGAKNLTRRNSPTNVQVANSAN